MRIKNIQRTVYSNRSTYTWYESYDYESAEEGEKGVTETGKIFTSQLMRRRRMVNDPGIEKTRYVN